MNHVRLMQKQKYDCCYIWSSEQRPRWEASGEGMWSTDPRWHRSVRLQKMEINSENICLDPFALSCTLFFNRCSYSITSLFWKCLEVSMMMSSGFILALCLQKTTVLDSRYLHFRRVFFSYEHFSFFAQQCPMGVSHHTGGIWRPRLWSCRLIWFRW